VKKKLIIILIWVLIWQLLSMLSDNRILMVGPGDTLGALLQMAGKKHFWQTVGTSLCRIMSGVLAGTIGGFLLAYAAGRFRLLADFLHPAITLLKAIPVVSFVILLLVRIGSRMTPVYVTALVTLPIAYLNLLSSIAQLDEGLQEMAKVYGMPFSRRLRYVELPQLWPQITASLSLAVGMGFKSGAAAEVIGQAKNTIGNEMYRSKIYLETADLFAWTAVIILLSRGMELLLRFLLSMAGGRGIRQKKTNWKKNAGAAAGDSREPLADTSGYRLPAGEKASLTGASGAGKTTVLRSLLGENPGAVVMFQEDRLLPGLSAVENCRVVQPKKTSVSVEAIRKELLRLLPEETLNRPVRSLSGGEMRRVALVRAFLKDSPMILLDEPFAGLDHETEEIVKAYILEKSRGKTVYVTDHDGTHFPEWKKMEVKASIKENY